MFDTVADYINGVAAILSILIAVTTLRMYTYLRTVYVLLIAIGFVYLCIIRILIAVEDLNILVMSADTSRVISAGAYLIIAIGTIGLFCHIRAMFTDAVRLLKRKGAVIPDKWKDVEAHVEDEDSKASPSDRLNIEKRLDQLETTSDKAKRKHLSERIDTIEAKSDKQDRQQIVPRLEDLEAKADKEERDREKDK
jgi:hypothetical protein